MKKKGRSILIVAAVLVVSFVLMGSLAAMRQAPERRAVSVNKQRVSTILVENSDIPVSIAVYGSTSAVEKVNIFAEVNGVLETSSSNFLAGNAFKKGDVLLDINNDEAEASLKSIKSSFLTQLTSLLVELKFEYPESYDAWAKYINDYKVEKPMAELPEVKDEKEKLFITSQGVYDSYYSILSQEIRLSKYQVTADFDGILTESNVKPGMLIMSGQKLGTYVKDDLYDVEASIKLTDVDLIAIGDKVDLVSPVTGLEVTGEVDRINSTIDKMTQTVAVYIRVSGEGVKDNMFFEGNINTSTSNYATKISRKLLQVDYVYTVDSTNTICISPVEVYQKYDDKAVIGGLADGIRIADRTSGIYEGLEVITDDDVQVKPQKMPTDTASENGMKRK